MVLYSKDIQRFNLPLHISIYDDWGGLVGDYSDSEIRLLAAHSASG